MKVELELDIDGNRNYLRVKDSVMLVTSNKIEIEGKQLSKLLEEDIAEYNPYDSSYGGEADSFIKAWVRIHNLEHLGELKIVKKEGFWADPKNWEPKFESEEGVIY